jgi:hypothetical protein
MSAFCPHCETDLDPRYGICPACFWDPAAVPIAPAQPAPERRETIAERYRGTAYESLPYISSVGERAVPRGRLFVIAVLSGTVAFYAAVMVHLGVIR